MPMGMKFVIGHKYIGERLEAAQRKLVGNNYTRKQIKSLLGFFGKETTENGTLETYTNGTNVYKFLPLPEPDPDVPIGLLKLKDIVEA